MFHLLLSWNHEKVFLPYMANSKIRWPSWDKCICTQLYLLQHLIRKPEKRTLLWNHNNVLVLSVPIGCLILNNGKSIGYHDMIYEIMMWFHVFWGKTCDLTLMTEICLSFCSSAAFQSWNHNKFLLLSLSQKWMTRPYISFSTLWIFCFHDILENLCLT